MFKLPNKDSLRQALMERQKAAVEKAAQIDEGAAASAERRREELLNVQPEANVPVGTRIILALGGIISTVKHG